MILLKNATYIDWKTLEFKPTNIIVETGLQGAISFVDDIEKTEADEIIDCKGKYVTKSFGVGHHHVYSSLARGMGAPSKNPENFPEILEYIWWTLDKSLNKEMIEYSALTTAIACAKAGSTFVIDHHASPYAVKDSLNIIAEAFDKVGVSHLLCYEISDRDGEEIAYSGLDETEEYLKNNQGLVGLHASFTVGNNTLKKAVSLMQKTKSGIHIHVAEDLSDQAHCLKTYGKRVINRLHENGVLDSSKTILAHGLHLDEQERNTVQNSKAWIVQNMESNLNNKVGSFSAHNMGDRIMLGTDGMHSDMLQSAKFAFFAGQLTDNISYESAYNRFRNIHNYLSANRFIGDGSNNLVVLDYIPPTSFSKVNFYGHFLFGLSSANIKHVISNGKLIVKDQIVQTVDESIIMKESQKLSLKLWDKMKNNN